MAMQTMPLVPLASPSNRTDDEDLDALEVRLTKAQHASTGENGYWHALNEVLEAAHPRLAELRAARAVIACLQADTDELAHGCPICNNKVTGSGERHINPDCSLAIYETLKTEQARY